MLIRLSEVFEVLWEPAQDALVGPDSSMLVKHLVYQNFQFNRGLVVFVVYTLYLKVRVFPQYLAACWVDPNWQIQDFWAVSEFEERRNRVFLQLNRD